MQFKIQNVKQLLALHTLIQSNEIASNRFFTKEIKVTLDLFEVLHDSPLSIVAPASKNPEYIDFADESDEIVFSFCIAENKMIEYGKDEDFTYFLADKDSYEIEKNSKLENAERAFLHLLNYDLSDGYFSEDVKHFKKTRPEMHLLVFGY